MPESQQFLPLEKLLKFPRGRKHVKIDQTVLSKLDLTVLRRSIYFGFEHHYDVRVAVTPDSRTTYHTVQLSITTDVSDWPEPTDGFSQLYSAALGVAGERASIKDESDGCCHHTVVAHQDHVIMEYYSVVASNGNDLAQMLRRKLDLVRDELPSIIRILAAGPIPGTTVYEDD